MMSKQAIVSISKEALQANKWFDIGMESGTKNTVICINEELELLRKYRKIRTKKQIIDHMQKFASKLIAKANHD